MSRFYAIPESARASYHCERTGLFVRFGERRKTDDALVVFEKQQPQVKTDLLITYAELEVGVRVRGGREAGGKKKKRLEKMLNRI